MKRLPLPVWVTLGLFFVVWLPIGGEEREDFAGDGTTLERIRESGVARVGFANEAPYAYLDPETGRLTGEAPEIARQVLASLGVERVDGVLTEFGSLIPGLQAGRFDLIAAGMYITPERCREIDFTRPTYGIGESFIVARGNPRGLRGYDDVASSEELTIGVVTGAVQLGYAEAMGIPRNRIVFFPDNPSGLSGVASGRVDALAVTRLTAEDLLAKDGGDDLEIAEPFEDPVIDGRSVRGYGAFGLRSEDDDLRQLINAELQTFLGSRAHLALVRPFGFSEATLPGDVTAEELCQPEGSDS
jgi:polar amino acid transport system substrate-binding protein